MKLSNKAYDVMKWVVIIVLPAVATLYAALASVWGWPFATEVTASITALTTFLGAVLCISTANYNAGGGQGETADTVGLATVGAAAAAAVAETTAAETTDDAEAAAEAETTTKTTKKKSTKKTTTETTEEETAE